MKKMKKRKLATLIMPIMFGFLLTTPTGAVVEGPLPPNQVCALRRSPSLFNLKPNLPTTASTTDLSAEQYSAQFGATYDLTSFDQGAVLANTFVDRNEKIFGSKAILMSE